MIFLCDAIVIENFLSLQIAIVSGSDNYLLFSCLWKHYFKEAHPLARLQNYLKLIHRYLRKVDCSRCISWYKIHLEEEALVPGIQQSRLARLPCQPDCLVSLPDLSACMPCQPDCLVSLTALSA